MMMGELYLDEEVENERIIGCRLYDKEFDQIQAFEKNQILMGIDPEDQDET